MKDSESEQKAQFNFKKKSSFYLWFQILESNTTSYFITLAAGLLSIVPATALVLLVTYTISMLQGTPRALPWPDLLGEHASRWVIPLVRGTAYESGLSLQAQKWFMVPALIATAVLGNLLKSFQEYKIEDIGERISRRLRSAVAAKFLRTNFEGAQQISGSLLANLVGDDTREIRQCFTRLFGSVPVELIAAFVYFTLLAVLDTQLFILFFAIFLPAGIIVRLTGKYLRSLAKAGVDVQTELTQSFLEKMRGWQTIRTFSAQDFELRRFDGKNSVIFNIWRRSARAKALSAPSVEWLGIAAGACVLILALRRVSEGALPSSILTAFLVTVAQLSNSFQTIVSQLNSTKKGNAALRRLKDFLDTETGVVIEKPPDSPDRIPDTEKRQHAGSFSFEMNAISLRHPSNDSHFLCRDLDVRLQNGDSLAITGPSGSGKSTLMECLAGLRKPFSGSTTLRLKDKCIENPTTAEHLKLAYLSQEPFVFAGSIGENVSYPEQFNSSSQKQAEKILDSLRKACLASKDIQQNALNLSGGERQRLIFARGFYNEPNLWMIDEGTSALDAQTEQELMNNLQSASPDSLKIIIAHRPSLIGFTNKRLTLG
ncbi:MAG: hypothetical protein RLZZ488_2812 [Pseudomonadota bacterium]